MKCDGTRPACRKCLGKGLECSGYGVRFRFNEGPAARGKVKGRASAVNAGRKFPKAVIQRALPDLVWPEDPVADQGSQVKEAARPSSMIGDIIGDASSGDFSSPPSEFLLDDVTVFDMVEMDGNTLDDLTLTMEPSSETLALPLTRFPHVESTTVGSLQVYQIPCTLEVMPPQYRELFAHFSEAVAPVMVVLDGKFNGYRDLILPMAYEDDLVKAAVSVVSMYHLAAQRPQLQHHADTGLQTIIQNLRHRADPVSSNANLLDLSAWTTIIVLLTGETVTGGSNLPILFRLLQHLATANTSVGQDSAMHSFLKEQTRMMTLFAQPLLGEVSGASTLSAHDKYFDFISNAAIFFPSLAPQIALYKAAIRSACNIYLTRVTKAPPHSETTAALEELKDLCLNIQPGQPGHHTLVWAYFIAAAESSTFEHRNFFTLRLQEVYSRTKFHNIPTALAALQELWKVQAERRWTEILPEVMPVFII